MEILIAYGVPQPVVSAINVMYTNTRAKVLSPDGDTDEFEILAGVLQGDTLAPFLFTIALDYALRIATKDETSVANDILQKSYVIQTLLTTLPSYPTHLKRRSCSS